MQWLSCECRLFHGKKAMAEPRRLCTSQGFTLLTVNMCECPFTLGMCQLSTLKNNSGDFGSKSQPHVRDELLGLIYLLTLVKSWDNTLTMGSNYAIRRHNRILEKLHKICLYLSRSLSERTVDR